MRGNQLCFALFAWFDRTALLAGIAKTATGKACNDCKTLGTGLCSNARTQTWFSKQPFFKSGHKKKRSSGVDGKTSDCLSRSCSYYRYFELRFR